MASTKSSSSNDNPVSSSSSKKICRWTDCDCTVPFDTVQELVDHVNTVHVEPLLSHELVLCLWEGCKVYNVPCQKKAWLTQHMRRHTNERPHKCIMNGCNQSFWNLDALNHHLQLHLLPSPSSSKKVKKKNSNNTEVTTNNGSNNGCPSSGSVNDDMSLKKSSSSGTLTSTDSGSNGGPVRGTSVVETEGTTRVENSCTIPLVPPQPIAVNGGLIHNDAIDSRIMSVIKKSVISQYTSNNTSTNNEECTSISTCTLTGKIIGQRRTFKRVEPDFLVQWEPRIIPDSWVCSSDYTGYKTIPLSELLHCQKATLVQSRYLTSTDTTGDGCLQSCTVDSNGIFVNKRKRKRNKLTD